MTYKLKIIIASTRPGRKGPAVAEWIFQKALIIPDFETELVDLAEVNLPFHDEAAHPRLKKYEHEHTKRWSEKIDSADAFIIVTPEYNFGYPAPLKNALDFLFMEWGTKPVAIVSYGGLAAGTRSAQLLKPVLTALNMMPIAEGVNIPFFTKHIDESGKFTGDETLEKNSEGMLKKLLHWTKGMKVMRENN